MKKKNKKKKEDDEEELRSTVRCAPPHRAVIKRVYTCRRSNQHTGGGGGRSRARDREEDHRSIDPSIVFDRHPFSALLLFVPNQLLALLLYHTNQ